MKMQKQRVSTLILSLLFLLGGMFPASAAENFDSIHLAPEELDLLGADAEDDILKIYIGNFIHLCCVGTAIDEIASYENMVKTYAIWEGETYTALSYKNGTPYKESDYDFVSSPHSETFPVLRHYAKNPQLLFDPTVSIERAYCFDESLDWEKTGAPITGITYTYGIYFSTSAGEYVFFHVTTAELGNVFTENDYLIPYDAFVDFAYDWKKPDEIIAGRLDVISETLAAKIQPYLLTADTPPFSAEDLEALAPESTPPTSEENPPASAPPTSGGGAGGDTEDGSILPWILIPGGCVLLGGGILLGAWLIRRKTH